MIILNQNAIMDLTSAASQNKQRGEEEELEEGD